MSIPGKDEDGAGYGEPLKEGEDFTSTSICGVQHKNQFEAKYEASREATVHPLCANK